MKVFRRRFVAHENDILSSLRTLLGGVGIEDGATTRRSRTRRKSRAKGCRADGRIDDWMQQLIELPGGNTAHCLHLVDEALAHHVPGDSHGSRGGSFPGTRLQQVQLPALDRELEVLHVAVVFLKPILRPD